MVCSEVKQCFVNMSLHIVFLVRGRYLKICSDKSPAVREKVWIMYQMVKARDYPK